MKNFFPHLLIALATVSLSAQEPPAIHTRLSLAVWYDGVNLRPIMNEGEKAGIDLYYLKQEQVTKAIAPFGDFGRTTTYAGPEDLALYLQPPNPEAPPTPAATIKLNPQVPDTAILLFPDLSVTPIRFKGWAFDNSLSAFPPQSLYIVNLFAKTLYLKIGNEQISLPAYGTKLIRVTEQINRGVNLMAVARDDDSNRAIPLIQRNIRMQPGSRLYLFIAPHPTKLKGADMRIMEAPVSEAPAQL